MLTRRHFLKNSTSVAVGGMLASSVLSRAAGATAGRNPILRVGLIGCGGRGTCNGDSNGGGELCGWLYWHFR